MADNYNPVGLQSLSDRLDRHKIETSRWINCVQVATIKAVDSAKNTVDAQIAGKCSWANGVTLHYPLMKGCPLFVLQGGGSWLDMPVAIGDTCLVLFNDRDIDIWWETGSTDSLCNTVRAHSLSDGFALVGVNSWPEALALNGSYVDLHGGPNPAWITSTQQAGVQGKLGASVQSSGGISGVQGIGAYVDGGTGAVGLTGTGVNLNAGAGLVEIKNAAQSLATLMNSLVTDLSTLSLVGTGVDAINPVFSGQMTALIPQFAALLTA